MQCHAKIGDNLDEIFARLHNMESKNEQDVYLQGLMNVHEVKRRRPRVPGSNRSNEKSFIYNILIGDTKIQVCRATFLAVHGVSIKRVKRLQRLAILGKSPKDLRGHNVKGNAIPADTKILIRNHIESFEVKESHYSNKTVKYLDARLNIKIMHSMFKTKHPDVKCSYSSFRNFFNENYNLRFGRPQVDCCGVCEELEVKLQNPFLCDAAKRVATAELLVHKRRAKKFYAQLKKEREDKQDHVLAISIDFMQNISLPNIPVQDTFYMRQLTLNVLGIHNIQTDQAKIYLYHEGQAKKGPNEVCSLLMDFLSEVPGTVAELHVYADNCSGQNKNHDLCRLLLALTDLDRFKRIEQYFPIRGHSFMPCDRDFGLIKRKLARVDRFYTIHEVTELIVTSSENPLKFIVTEVQTENIICYKKWWQEFYKKSCVSEETRGRQTPVNQKVSFGISTLMHFSYDSELKGILKARSFIDGCQVNTFNLRQPGSGIPRLPNDCAYPEGRVGIKGAKINDIVKLMQYIPQEHQEFYREICEWVVGEESGDEA